MHTGRAAIQPMTPRPMDTLGAHANRIRSTECRAALRDSESSRHRLLHSTHSAKSNSTVDGDARGLAEQTTQTVQRTYYNYTVQRIK